MATRQRRGRPRKGDYTSSSSYSDARETRLTSRRNLLLSLLAVTTAIFFAFQISRYRNEKSATGRFISSMINKNSVVSVRRPAVAGDAAPASDDISKVVDFKDRISAMAKHFQKELGAVSGSTPSKDEQQGRAEMTVVTGEDTVDRPIPSLISTEYLPEKSLEEAARDQQVGLEDLDQETLKAMFDALYARD